MPAQALRFMAFFALAWLAAQAACAPSIIDDCRTDADCAEGVCDEGYCVPKRDAGADAQPDAGDAAGLDAAAASGDDAR